MEFAERLDGLFKKTAGPNGRPATLQDVLDRMKERGIATMSSSYLHQLRTGEAKNPRYLHVRALADAFGVPITYFDDDRTNDIGNAADLDAESEIHLTQQERTVALRVHGLSAEALASIHSIVELARRSEGLDEPPKSGA